MTHDITLNLINEAATINAGADFSKAAASGLVVYCHGDLGAGKTTFVRGFLHALGHVGKVKSPTYTLVEPYHVDDLNIYHFDLYRFIDEEEWDAAGFRDYFNPSAICLIEWPEKAESILPQPDIALYLQPSEEGRILRLVANSTLGKQVLQKMTCKNV
ncbi:MAG: tRNA (adenosine(37)-N6)-threonylcarbamoyltransferase complex ATPase subunit type 1 TsaE [Methylophilaceae bacterium]|nr:tRNA (adenosine(37)-N6)-threonylcarbamoyltransferase complex ATPase subunit type 1 TsaE [Methylophilaceae bacterium]